MGLEDLEQNKEAIVTSNHETLHQAEELIIDYIRRYGFTGEEILNAFQYFGYSPQYLLESNITMGQYIVQILSYIIKEYEEENEVELEDDESFVVKENGDLEIKGENVKGRSELLDLEERE